MSFLHGAGITCDLDDSDSKLSKIILSKFEQTGVFLKR